MDNSPDDRSNITLAALLFEGGLAVLALIVGWTIGQPPLKSIEWTWSAAPRSAAAAAWGVAAALPMAAGLLAVDRLPLNWLADLRRVVYDRVVPLFARSTLAQLAWISLAAGIGEEMLFRGVLQQALASRIGPPLGDAVAVAAAAAALGVCHWLTGAYALLATLTGAYLGCLYLVAGSHLLAPVVAHSLYDFAALVYLVKRKPDRPH
jgi:membrane protease YdiL (CAAX protease family)